MASVVVRELTFWRCGAPKDCSHIARFTVNGRGRIPFWPMAFGWPCCANEMRSMGACVRHRPFRRGVFSTSAPPGDLMIIADGSRRKWYRPIRHLWEGKMLRAQVGYFNGRACAATSGGVLSTIRAGQSVNSYPRSLFTSRMPNASSEQLIYAIHAAKTKSWTEQWHHQESPKSRSRRRIVLGIDYQILLLDLVATLPLGGVHRVIHIDVEILINSLVLFGIPLLAQCKPSGRTRQQI